MTTLTAIRSVDGRGKTISTAVLYDVEMAVRDLHEGDIVEVFTDDYSPLQSEVATWCRATGHHLLLNEPITTGRRFLIERRTPVGRDTALAMVISPDGLEELLSPLGFALGAALQGIEVSLYLQGPAVHALAPGYRPKLSGWSRPFSRIAARQMAQSGHVAPQVKLQQLQELGAHLYACGPSMEHFKVDPANLMFDDVQVVEYVTFMAVMAEADMQLFI
jgi:predicted peroxiredoxin/TusA-related sulfurtransferase